TPWSPFSGRNGTAAWKTSGGPFIWTPTSTKLNKRNSATMAIENEFAGLKVTVMGLGLNGGGLASTLHFARRGAEVTVTDLRTEDILKPTMDELAGYPIRYVLGKHEEADFRGADIVVKNPG